MRLISDLAISDFKLCECLLDNPSEVRGPAEIGVVGLVARFGDLESGSGNDAELRRASRGIFSNGDGRFTSMVGGRVLDPEEVGLGAGERGVLAGDFAGDFAGGLAAGLIDCRVWALLAWPLVSGALVVRPSFARLILPLPAPTVCDRDGAIFLAGVGAGVASVIVSTGGRGFLACATASGPAQ